MIRMLFVSASLIMLSSAALGQGMPAAQCGSCAEDLKWVRLCTWPDGSQKNMFYTFRGDDQRPGNKKVVKKINGTYVNASCGDFVKYCPRCIN